MARMRARSGDRHWDGGRPALKKPTTKLGKSTEQEFTKRRFAALRDIGPMTMALPDGDYVEGDRASLDWLLERGLVELAPQRRPGGPQSVTRTAEGERVLALWSERS